LGEPLASVSPRSLDNELNGIKPTNFPTMPPGALNRFQSRAGVRRFAMLRIHWSLCHALSLVAAVAVHSWSVIGQAQTNLTEPVYRVASTNSASSATTPDAAAQPAAAPRVAAQPAAAARLDFKKLGDEHPLMPVVRGLQASQEIMDKSVRDYSCTFVKRERVNGQLGEQQHIFMKVMHQPFSVYMLFKQPFAGREVVYVDGQNNNKIVALDVGVKRYLGKMSLDPNGALAMKGQKHPITSVGIRNLCAKLVKVSEGELKYGECDVTINPDAKIDNRPTTMVQIVHPMARPEFKNHVARIFFDNEHKIPIHYDAYSWPAQPGGKPQLEESYTYQNLQLNNNFTATDFDPNNPAIFKN
jgi:hypothetical protein